MVLAASEGKETRRIGFEDFDVWPDWCLREDKDCRQCHFQGKIACHPRFRQGLRMVSPNTDALLKEGKTPNEIHKLTGAKIGTIYSRGQKLRQKGELISLRPLYSEEKKKAILDLVRQNPAMQYKDAATVLQVEPSYISRLCSKNGIHRRKALETEKGRGTLRAMSILRLNPQRSIASIADEIGVPPSTLITRLRNRGVLPVNHATRLVLDVIRAEVKEAVISALAEYFKEK